MNQCSVRMSEFVAGREWVAVNFVALDRHNHVGMTFWQAWQVQLQFMAALNWINVGLWE
jgi:hypothetical protein